MKRLVCQMAGLLAAVMLVACGKDVNSPQGFRLPDGDVDAGRIAFARVGCVQCHIVAAEPRPTLDMPRKMEVLLGGPVVQVKTYAQLVTSVIYPSHAIKDGNSKSYQDEQGQSLMPDLSDKMTVRQMIDITQYLQSHYKVIAPSYPDYPIEGGVYR